MSVKLEFINVLIPIKNIEKCSEIHIFEELLEIDKKWLGITIWHDGLLYREGAMNSLDIELILKKWQRRGLNLFRTENGIKMWDELCVVDSASGLTLQCNWLKLDLKKLEAEFMEQKNLL